MRRLGRPLRNSVFNALCAARRGAARFDVLTWKEPRNRAIPVPCRKTPWIGVVRSPLRILGSLLLFGAFQPVQALDIADLSAKGKLTFVAGSGVDEIYRAEGWLAYDPLSLDLKVKLEQKNQRALGKARIQLLPIRLDGTAWGLAVRYQKRERDSGVGALGAAMRVEGEGWKWPVRYYPELNLFHSKPVMRHGRLRADCQIVYDHKEDDGSLRPGMDWSFTDHFSVGLEGRAYSDPNKNYLGVRLSLSGKR